MVKTIDYEFPRGDTYALRKFRITDINNNVIDLTGKDQLYFTVKTDSNSNKVLIQKRKDSGIELEEDGYYHITIEPADTNKLEYGSYVYDISWKSTEAKTIVKTLINGTITLTDEVTWAGDE